ncbi:MAG: hypothetical protein QHH26_06805 [Armatimonadota bacterium]|nr:hypothetical protein [Armatimonadota bacterium]
MAPLTIPEGVVTDIQVETQPAGLTAMYMVEAQNAEESKEIAVLFKEFASAVDVVQLCTGRLMGYAVRARDQEQNLLLDQIYKVITSRYHGFVIRQKPIEQCMFELCRELCRDYGGKMLKIPTCDICGKYDPFPSTIVNLLDERGTIIASRTYCASCTAEWGDSPSKEFLISLLQADRRNFGSLLGMNIVRKPLRRKHTIGSKPRGKYLAFKIMSDADQQSAMG